MEVGIGMQLVHALDIEEKMSMSFHMDEDIDIDMDIDADVFRPSSMLDAKIEEEYGPFYSSRFQNGDKDFLCQERDFIDLEQVLLCDSNDMSVAHMIQNDEEEYMRRSVSAVELISHDSKFLIQKTDRSKIFRIGNTITALELPPKYSQDSVGKRCSARKKVVHRRTFGVLNKSFSFGGSTCSFQPATNVKAPESHAETPQRIGVTAISCIVENEQPFSISTEVSPGKLSIRAHKTLSLDDVQFSTPFRSHSNDMSHLKTPTCHASKALGISISPTSARKMPVVQINSSLKNVVGDASSFGWQAEVEKACDSLEKTISLPPRYYRGAQSSPEKRRIHTTTFGSFARSFSFSPSPQNLSS